MSLADLLGSPVCCVPCARKGHPAAAVPGTDVCLACQGTELARQAVAPYVSVTA